MNKKLAFETISKKIEEVYDQWEKLDNTLMKNTPSYQIIDPIKRAEMWIEEQKVKQLQLKLLDDILFKEIEKIFLSIEKEEKGEKDF